MSRTAASVRGPASAPLLDGIDLTGAVLTADAHHAPDYATYLHGRGAHYLAAVKRNHPGLHEKVRRLPWRDIRLDHYECGRGHHRDEIRGLKTAAFIHLDHPHARQALQVVCWRKDLGTGKLTIERMTWSRACPPGAATGSEPFASTRGHCHIENQLHHVRDLTFHDDASKTRSRQLPRVIAGLRNLAIGVNRQDGHTNIAPPSAAPRETTYGPSPPPALHDESGHEITSQTPWSSGGQRGFVRCGPCGWGQGEVWLMRSYPGRRDSGGGCHGKTRHSGTQPACR
ncbi:hypothetical protein ACIF9R_29390 [Streptomyces sp. NPDC086080]|uniref:hypothetical protein n=1 Tax=Streptomyces sp. NPDC086080 TaxID=3365748 RepID=UPI0037D0B58B